MISSHTWCLHLNFFNYIFQQQVSVYFSHTPVFLLACSQSSPYLYPIVFNPIQTFLTLLFLYFLLPYHVYLAFPKSQRQFSLLSRGVLISQGPICQLLILFSEKSEFYLENLYLCLYLIIYSLALCSSFSISCFTLLSLIQLEDYVSLCMAHKHIYKNKYKD